MNVKNYLAVLILLCSFTAPEQLLKTSLQVVVRNELGNTESDVNVRLFKTKSDYDKLENAATETLKTDKNGKVVFKDVVATEYYINAEKGSLNNFGAGEETTKLQANRINKITIVITE
jgi:hypothetical protein